MTCANCGATTSRVKIYLGKETCHSCAGFSESGGVRTDGIMSRERVRMDAVKYEGDALNPWAYSKSEKHFVPNEEFVKRHASNAHNFFTPADLAKSHPKLAGKLGKGREQYAAAEGVGESAPELQKVFTVA